MKRWVEAYEEVRSNVEDLQVLHDFFKEGEAEEALQMTAEKAEKALVEALKEEDDNAS